MVVEGMWGERRERVYVRVGWNLFDERAVFVFPPGRHRKQVRLDSTPSTKAYAVCFGTGKDQVGKQLDFVIKVQIRTI